MLTDAQRASFPGVIKDAKLEAIGEIRAALLGEDTVEWARKADGSFISYPALMEGLDTVEEEILG